VKAPLAGIHAGLSASKTPWNLILTCDMPMVTKELIDYLISNLKNDSGLLVPGHDGYIEPLCGFYHQKLLPEIEANIKQEKLSPLDLIAGVKEGVADVHRLPGADLVSLFKNVNTISDLT
jgi:molybdopterin-guanine dinucleotide biosynthesis protein A